MKAHVPTGPLKAMYAVAFLFVLVPVLEFAGRVWPLQPGAPAWRYGAIGLLTNAGLLPILGLAMGICVAMWLEHGRTLRAFGVVALLASLSLFVLTPFFLLDALQLRGSVNPAMKRSFDITSAKALVTFAAMIATLGFLGLSTIRLKLGTSSARMQRPAASDLVVRGGDAKVAPAGSR